MAANYSFERTAAMGCGTVGPQSAAAVLTQALGCTESHMAPPQGHFVSIRPPSRDHKSLRRQVGETPALHEPVQAISTNNYAE